MIPATWRRWFGAAIMIVLVPAWLGAQAVAPVPDESLSFLWHVQGKACHGYLLGSVHAAKGELYPLDAEIEDAFARSEIVVFEVDMSNMGEAALMMMAKGALEGEDRLSAILSPETYQAVKEFLDERGMSISAFEKVQPWFLALTIAALELQQAGYTPDLGIDQHFADRAEKLGKETRHLETLEEQLGFFTALVEIEGDRFLSQTLLELETVIPLMEDVFESWERGDAAGLEELLLTSFKEYPTVYERLVLERNEKWLVQIQELLRGSQDFMIVVGSLHMVGEDGLVKRLEEHGWQVTQQ